MQNASPHDRAQLRAAELACDEAKTLIRSQLDQLETFRRRAGALLAGNLASVVALFGFIREDDSLVDLPMGKTFITMFAISGFLALVVLLPILTLESGSNSESVADMANVIAAGPWDGDPEVLVLTSVRNGYESRLIANRRTVEAVRILTLVAIAVTVIATSGWGFEAMGNL